MPVGRRAMISCPDRPRDRAAHTPRDPAHSLCARPEAVEARSASGAECTPGATGLLPGERLRLKMNDPVVIAVPPVDDAGLAGVGVDEQIEIVPDQLHLVESLVER